MSHCIETINQSFDFQQSKFYRISDEKFIFKNAETPINLQLYVKVVLPGNFLRTLTIQKESTGFYLITKIGQNLEY